MCCYKLVSVKFKVFGIQTKSESFIDNAQWGIFLKFHKQVFTLLDEWIDMSMDDIRKMESDLKHELDQKLDGFNLETRDQKRVKTEDHLLLKPTVESNLSEKSST